MWTFDLPLEELENYKPPRTAQPDTLRSFGDARKRRVWRNR